MPALRIAALSAALLAVVPLTPALAVAPFGPTYRVTPNNCGFVSATSSSGQTRGYEACTNGWRFVQGSGSSWTSSASPYSASENVLAVAMDGASTWQVTSNSGGTYLRSRTGSTYNPGKRLTAQRVGTGDAAIVALGGRYLVVWSQGNGAGGAHLWEAHTLGSNTAPRLLYGNANQPNWREVNPSLAYQATTHRTVLAWSHQLNASQNSVFMTNGAGGPWATVRTVAGGAWQPSVAVEGSTVAIGYGREDGTTCRCGGAVATGTTSGMTSVHALSGQLNVPPKVALSNGVLGAVWIARSSQATYPLRVATRSSGVWSERVIGTLSNPYGLGDVASVAGRLRVFASYPGNYVGVRSQ